MFRIFRIFAARLALMVLSAGILGARVHQAHARHRTEARPGTVRHTIAAQRRKLHALTARLLAERAARLTDRGDTLTAIQLALQVFRGRGIGGAKPVEPAAESSLANALYRNHLQFIVPRARAGYAAAAYSFDGKRFVTVDRAGHVAVWATRADGRLGRRTRRPDFGAVKTLVVNPARPIILFTRGDGRYFTWNYRSDKTVEMLSGHCKGGDGRFSFDRTGARLAVFCHRDMADGRDTRTLRLIDVASGQIVVSFHGLQRYALSGNGRRLVTLRNKSKVPTIEVWDATDGHLVKAWPAPETGDIATTFSGEVVIAILSNGRVRLWQSASGTVLTRELPVQGRTFDVFAGTVGRLLATSGDDGLWVWDGRTGTPVQHMTEGRVLGFLPNGLLAIESADQVELWRYAVDSRLGILRPVRQAILFTGKQAGSVQRIDGNKWEVMVISDGEVSVWRANSTMLLAANDHAGECLRSATLSGNGKVIAAIGAFRQSKSYVPSECAVVSPANAVIFWDASDLTETKRLNLGPFGELTELALSYDGTRALIGTYAGDSAKERGLRSYAVIDANTGKRLLPLGKRPLLGLAAGLSKHGETLFLAVRNAVVTRRVADGAQMGDCKVGEDDILGIASSDRSGRLALYNENGDVWVLDPATCHAKLTSLFAEKVGDTMDLIFKNGMVAGRSYVERKKNAPLTPNLQVWNVSQGRRVANLSGHAAAESGPFDFFAARDRALLAQTTGEDGIDDHVEIADLITGRRIFDFQIDRNGCCQLSDIRFFPDGQRLLTVWSERGVSRLRVWRMFPTFAAMLSFVKAVVPVLSENSIRPGLAFGDRIVAS